SLRLGIGNDGQHPIEFCPLLVVGDLIGPQQGMVDRAHTGSNTIGRIEGLVELHWYASVGIGRKQGSAEVNGLQPSLRHLHRLLRGDRSQRGNERLRAQQLPKTLLPWTGPPVLDVDCALEPFDVGVSIGSSDAPPARSVPEWIFGVLGWRHDAVVSDSRMPAN